MFRLIPILLLLCIVPVYSTSYTMQQVSYHSTKYDCWAVVSNRIYNYTTLIQEGAHSNTPNGTQSLINACGQDRTAGIEKAHEGGVAAVVASLDKRPELFIGVVVASRYYTIEQVSRNRLQTRCWVVISGRIYNYTTLIAEGVHSNNPNGVQNLINACGQDITADADADGDGDKDGDGDGDGEGVEMAHQVIASLETRPELFIGTIVSSIFYSTQQVAMHNQATDCWAIINGYIFNYTTLIVEGSHYNATTGMNRLVSSCGKDSTVGVATSHQGGVDAILNQLDSRPELYIGAVQNYVLPAGTGNVIGFNSATRVKFETLVPVLMSMVVFIVSTVW